MCEKIEGKKKFQKNMGVEINCYFTKNSGGWGGQKKITGCTRKGGGGGGIGNVICVLACGKYDQTVLN